MLGGTKRCLCCFPKTLQNREVVCGICSEEDEEFILVNPNASYVVMMDPLDGALASFYILN